MKKTWTDYRYNTVSYRVKGEAGGVGRRRGAASELGKHGLVLQFVFFFIKGIQRKEDEKNGDGTAIE
jgi:hypothetical protein